MFAWNNWHCHWFVGQTVLWCVKWISRGMYPLERESSRAMSSPTFRMPRDFSPSPVDACSRTFRAGRIVKSDIRTTGMNSNETSPPVGWFARRNVIFITSVVPLNSPENSKYYIYLTNASRAAEQVVKIWSKSKNDRWLWKWREHSRQENITQRQSCARTNIIFCFFL